LPKPLEPDATTRTIHPGNLSLRRSRRAPELAHPLRRSECLEA
jgi:hypothetical protein